jgi:hypothetical protein
MRYGLGMMSGLNALLLLDQSSLVAINRSGLPLYLRLLYSRSKQILYHANGR